MLDGISKINQEQFEEFGDPETQTRISQYEMAFRMQSSVPELMDVTKEPKSVTDLYGPDAQRPGSFARNCILARRMAERGVPFIHLFHRGWDHHGGLPGKFPKQCKDIDQPAAALIKDLKQRGMLDETLVICGGEFGRTIYSQGNSPRPITGATTIAGASPPGLPAADSRPVMNTGKPMIIATTS